MYSDGICMELFDQRQRGFTVVQVATNDLIILIAFTPIVAFLLGVGGVTIPWDVVLFVVIPLTGGIITRNYITKKRGLDYFEKSFIPKFGNITTIRSIANINNNLFIPGRCNSE